MRTEQAARVFVFALLAVTLYLLFLVFKPFLPGILWAIFLATAFHPLYCRFVKILRGREWAAAVVTTGLVAALIILPAGVIVTSLARSLGAMLPELEERVRVSRQLAEAAASDDEPHERRQPPPSSGVMDAPAGEERSVGEGQDAEPGPASAPSGKAQEDPRLPFIREIETLLGPYVDVSRLDLEGTALATLKRVGQGLARQTSSVLQDALRTLISFLIMIFTMVVMFKEGSRVVEAVRRLLPLQEHDKEEAFKLLHEVSRAIFYGVMMTAMVQALIGTVGWLIVGLPAPTTFGIAMFFCALIPIGGTALVWGPGAIYLFLQGHYVKAVFLLLWGGLFVALIDNFLRPIFISGRTRMHILLVFFGILGGIMAFGFAGLFLGPLVITLALFLLEVVRRDLLSGEGSPPSDTASAG
jgi:predicted PurR-regulated permease PerM